MKKLYLISIYFFIPFILFAQKHDYNWIAGRYSPSFGVNMNFNNSPFSIEDTVPLALYMSASSCAISDKYGNLEFYTNGYWIANAQHEVMLNGNIAEGDTVGFDFCPFPGSTIVLPNPKNVHQYYVFTLIYYIYPNLGGTPSYLKYSVVDMSANNGKGAVVNKLVTAIADTLGVSFLTATKHANGIDWWIVMPELGNHNFYTVLVGENGIQSVSRQIRNNITTLPNRAGTARFSPNGQKYILKDNSGELKVFNFNRCTGELTNEQTDFLPFVPGYYDAGVAVSPSNQYLYITHIDSLLQYDLSAPNLTNSKKLITTTNGGGFGSLALAPDNKIYVTAEYPTNPQNNKLSIIDQPDNMGIACNYLPLQITLPIIDIFDGLTPNYPNYRLGALSPTACDSTQNITQEIEEKGIHFYPNPASSLINLAYSPQYRGAKCGIINTLGVNVQSFTLAENEMQFALNVDKLPSGVYFMYIGNEVFKWIKE